MEKFAWDILNSFKRLTTSVSKGDVHLEDLVCLLRIVIQTAKRLSSPTSVPVGYYQLQSSSNSNHLAASLVRNMEFYFTPELPHPLSADSIAQQ